MRVEPFTIAVPDTALDDLAVRLSRARWPEPLEGIGWEQGTDQDYLERLVDYWRSGFDWRAQEARLNGIAQFRATVGGQVVHFLHVRARTGRGLPILITHGWPGGVAELLAIIPLLTDPAAHGGDAEDAFDVVAPSLPGYGFSPPPQRSGMNVAAIADLWAELMTGLGYGRFAAQGGDWGAGVATALAHRFPERVIGLHLNYIPGAFPFQALPDLTGEVEASFLAARAAWTEAEGGYGHIQRTRPQTLAFALNDSPIGLCSWIVEKFRGWSDCDGDVERAFTPDDLLTNVCLYWFTQSIGASMRLYWEAAGRPFRLTPGERITVPCAIAHFPKELPMPPRSLVERVYDVRRWTAMPRGGHFAALEQPELLAEDIRSFFRPYRR